MFDRISYKQKAKTQLKGYFLFPVIIALICGILPSLFSVKENITSLQNLIVILLNEATIQEEQNSNYLLTILTFIVSAILAFASIYFFIAFTKDREKTSFSTFIKGFNLFDKAILAQLWQTLWITLWTLVFIIPGFIKVFSYSLMPYIIAENPKIGIRKSMRLSIILTKGHKWEIFVLGLSFIGWYILGILTLCIGYLWVYSYIQTTMVYMYHDLKDMAIKANLLSEEDFSRNVND